MHDCILKENMCLKGKEEAPSHPSKLIISGEKAGRRQASAITGWAWRKKGRSQGGRGWRRKGKREKERREECKEGVGEGKEEAPAAVEVEVEVHSIGCLHHRSKALQVRSLTFSQELRHVIILFCVSESWGNEGLSSSP